MLENKKIKIVARVTDTSKIAKLKTGRRSPVITLGAHLRLTLTRSGSSPARRSTLASGHRSGDHLRSALSARELPRSALTCA